MRGRAMLLVVAMVGALVVSSGVALAASFTCAGSPCVVPRGPDVIEGTDTAETIRALANDDRVLARGDNDGIRDTKDNCPSTYNPD